MTIKKKFERGSGMDEITVIDSIMGSGKTTWAINKINSSPDEKFIYITPYLDEIKRVRDLTKDKNKMYEPVYKGNSKTNHFHELLADGKSVCSTHSLFQNANQITREALMANEYILILDEVMNVVEELTNFTSHDLDTLLSDDLAYIEDDYLLWNPSKMDYYGRYDDIKSMALNRNLIFVGDKILFWNFPVDIFNYFKEVYVLTYLFDAQIQRYYYDFHNINYIKKQVDSNYNLVNFTREQELFDISKIRHLVNIYEGKLNNIGEADYSLSKNWFERQDKTTVKMLKNNLVNWFNNINKQHKAENRLWTTFKSAKPSLDGQGYARRFISLNLRATNDYIESLVLAYCCNRYIRPTIKSFFSKRNITINEDMYATSEMIQWIWRSRVRRGDEVFIYIPSKRMRDLLKQYLSI